MKQFQSYRILRTFGLIAAVLLISACFKSDPTRANSINSLKIIRLLVDMESSYLMKNKRYATLAELGPGGVNIVPGDVANGESMGYLFQVESSISGFKASCWPKLYKTTGYRSLFVDETGVIRETWENEKATSRSLPLNTPE